MSSANRSPCPSTGAALGDALVDQWLPTPEVVQRERPRPLDLLRLDRAARQTGELVETRGPQLLQVLAPGGTVDLGATRRVGVEGSQTMSDPVQLRRDRRIVEHRTQAAGGRQLSHHHEVVERPSVHLDVRRPRGTHRARAAGSARPRARTRVAAARGSRSRRSRCVIGRFRFSTTSSTKNSVEMCVSTTRASAPPSMRSSVRHPPR